jgi:hypothetical protein
MFKFIFAASLGAALAFSPLAAVAQTPAATGASAMHHHATTHRPTRSYKSEMRHRSNMSKERARAGAEHVRTMNH